MKRVLWSAVAAGGLGIAVGWTPGCSSSSSNTGGGETATTAAAVAGAVDSHCSGKQVVTADPSICHATLAEDDAGMSMGDSGSDKSDYGDTMYNFEGDDDDCKYHLTWASTSVAQKTDVTFTLTATNKKDNSPLAGAPILAEVFLDDTHPAPNTTQATREASPGVYTVGPIQFDAAGKWTVRFHLHDECNDSETSPHGHGAFFVHVP